jgi:hypothetical protein
MAKKNQQSLSHFAYSGSSGNTTAKNKTKKKKKFTDKPLPPREIELGDIDTHSNSGGKKVLYSMKNSYDITVLPSTNIVPQFLVNSRRARCIQGSKEGKE